MDKNTIKVTGFNLLAVGVAAFCGYTLYESNTDGVTVKELLTYGGACVAALIYLVTNNLQSLKGLISRQKYSERVYFPQDYEKRDFECLNHLKKRVVSANSAEGIKQCADLAATMFSLNMKTNETGEENV